MDQDGGTLADGFAVLHPTRHARARGESAEAAAKTLADYTFKKAADERHMSPFAYAAQANGHRYVGGKVRRPLVWP